MNGLKFALQISFGLYFVLIVVGLFLGAVKGSQNFVDWLQTRSYRKIEFENIEPIINIVCDVGQFIFLTASSAFASSFVAATFPISVPLLLHIFQK